MRNHKHLLETIFGACVTLFWRPNRAPVQSKTFADHAKLQIYPVDAMQNIIAANDCKCRDPVPLVSRHQLGIIESIRLVSPKDLQRYFNILFHPQSTLLCQFHRIIKHWLYISAAFGKVFCTLTANAFTELIKSRKSADLRNG